jgi:uncharacterized protein (DUF4415 family)
MLKTIEEQLADLQAMSDDDIDLSDIPECSQLQWDKATIGKYFRVHQTPVTIDDDLIEWFMNKHENINDILRQYVLQHQ